MATLDCLKQALGQNADAETLSSRQPLSESQYSTGFDVLMQSSGRIIYDDFIIPQLNQLLAPLVNLRLHISILEIGPGPESILGYLPGHLRRRVKTYTAFEPNGLMAKRLKVWLRPISIDQSLSPFPCLERTPDIHEFPFVLEDKIASGASSSDEEPKYDIILFCHSMYGLEPKDEYIKKALAMLVEQPHDGMVVVFHRDKALHLDSLVCHRTASFPAGVVRVRDNDETLNHFAPFVAGFVMEDPLIDKVIRAEWREVCRNLGRYEEAHPDHLSFSSPNVMVAFTRHATALPKLTAHVPLAIGGEMVKNREACLHRSAARIRPTEVRHVQKCVHWALKHKVSLTVVGGSHSGHCLWPNVVSVDMGAFDQVHVLIAGKDGGDSDANLGSLVIVEAGCKTGDIVRKMTAAGVTVPLGARPSVGAGSWLQGGIGHLARLHGLACDNIVGAVVISVDSGQVLCIGHVPSQHRPVGAVRPENEADLLWAIKGAGTNIGIVVSTTFKACAAPIYSSRNYVVSLSDDLEARSRLTTFSEFIAKKLPRTCSADAYLYWDASQLYLGVTVLETSTAGSPVAPSTTGSSIAPSTLTHIRKILGPEQDVKTVDGTGLFETEMYVSKMHGGHGAGKTSSFKRCLFLKDIARPAIIELLLKAINTHPSPLCYLHLLHGGGAVVDIAADATAFGCRDWDFACVITGVWPRNQDGTDVARSAVQWVYDVAESLLGLSQGVYGADLGPDPRDATLAAKAFGPNQFCLAGLKRTLDPHNVLAYACPLPKAPKRQKLIILVTGETCAGKDFCADIWASFFMAYSHQSVTHVASISDVTKREYAAATGANIRRLLEDRGYKEDHRPMLTEFFNRQVKQRPQLPEEHLLSLINEDKDVNVLLITGMRDKAPIATFAHLAPESRLIEVYVQTNAPTRWGLRRGLWSSADNSRRDSNSSTLTALGYRPSLIFDNSIDGKEPAISFAERYLLPFLHNDLQRLANMVRSVPSFPSPEIEFRHILGITQQKGGLNLCTILLQSHFIGNWAKIDAIACCEAGGFIYGSALASRVNVPMVLIREAGKLPPPTISVSKPASHISSFLPHPHDVKEKRIEMERDVLRKNASVVVVDNVLCSGETLCAVLQLLVGEAGVAVENVSVMVVAEFPIHRGRGLLWQRGFGKVNVQSLLVLGGA